MLFSVNFHDVIIFESTDFNLCFLNKFVFRGTLKLIHRKNLVLFLWQFRHDYAFAELEKHKDTEIVGKDFIDYYFENGLYFVLKQECSEIELRLLENFKDYSSVLSITIKKKLKNKIITFYSINLDEPKQFIFTVKQLYQLSVIYNDSWSYSFSTYSSNVSNNMKLYYKVYEVFNAINIFSGLNVLLCYTDIKPHPPSMTLEDWKKHFKSDGSLKSFGKFKEEIFEKGVIEDNRVLAYKYLFGYYKAFMDETDKKNYDDLKRKQYENIYCDEIKFAHEFKLIELDYNRLSFEKYSVLDFNKLIGLKFKNIMRKFISENNIYWQEYGSLIMPILSVDPLNTEEYECFWLFKKIMKTKKYFSQLKLFYHEFGYDFVKIMKYLSPKSFSIIDFTKFRPHMFSPFLSNFSTFFSGEDNKRYLEIYFSQNKVKKFEIFLCISQIIKKLCDSQLFDECEEIFEIFHVNKIFTIFRSSGTKTNGIVWT
ncbi:hypothetical protein HZS_5863 [Henneguya salminicola]|nr:hypothetical protein HZS_5863 [Henneguya salminicola]